MVVIGAGLSGLAFAYRSMGHHEVTVLETSARPGGLVSSLREDGRVLDQGPNGWLSGEPALEALLDDLGLRPEVVAASAHAKHRWIWYRDRLHAVNPNPMSLLGSSLVSLGGKVRALREPTVPRGGEEDETVAAFVARRFGPEVVAPILAPICVGVFASPPERLSVAAAFPFLVQAERDHGSVLKAGRGKRGRAPMVLSTLRGGVGALPEALARALGPRVHLETPATAIHRAAGGGWTVRTAHGEHAADQVVLAAPALAQAELLRPVAPEAALVLERQPSSPVAVVSLGFSAHTWPHRKPGFGVLVAPTERFPRVLGVLFTSDVFPHEAPPGELLVRCLIGGGVEPEAVGEADEALVARALEALHLIVGPTKSEPTFTHVTRHRTGIPRYEPGQLARERALAGALEQAPGLWSLGNHRGGVSMRDCVRNAAAAATALRADAP